MGDLSQLSIVLILLMEVAVLTYAEYRAWQTLYTPLCALMLPYVIVLLVTIAIAGHFGFVPFNYDSIWVWVAGLPLFALPSMAAAVLMRRLGEPVCPQPIREVRQEPVKALRWLSFLLIAMLLVKLMQTLRNGLLLFGTDDFADEFSAHGLFAHLRTMLMPILIISLYEVGKGRRWLWVPIALMLSLQFVNMVKGAIIIPMVAAILMRLYMGKMRLNLMLIAAAVGGAVAIFFLMYMVIPLMGNGGEADMNLVVFVSQHIVHYFTSGTLGWSLDLDMGMPDRSDFETIVSPFTNIWHTIRGEELSSPLNPFYLNTGITLTNVRTHFGTLWVYSDMWLFITYTIVLSTFIYIWKMAAMITGNAWIHVILFYYCGLLSVGWFEFYFFHFDIIEIPLLSLLYAWISDLTTERRPMEGTGKEVSFG